MKAAVCEAFSKPLVIKDVPEPSVGPEEVLIRMKGCGVCHSDLHLVDGEWADWGTPLPIIPGHEVTGLVEKAVERAAGRGGGARGGGPVDAVRLRTVPRLPVRRRDALPGPEEHGGDRARRVRGVGQGARRLHPPDPGAAGSRARGAAPVRP